MPLLMNFVLTSFLHSAIALVTSVETLAALRATSIRRLISDQLDYVLCLIVCTFRFLT